MKTTILTLLVLLPELLFAATDCRIIEYADHYLAECVGDELTGPAAFQPSIMPQPALTQSLQSSDTQDIRSPQPATSVYSAAITNGTAQTKNIKVLLGGQNDQHATAVYPVTSASGAAQNENIKSLERVQDDQAAKQQAGLSRRNYAKIEAAHMKELKHKAQLETTQ